MTILSLFKKQCTHDKLSLNTPCGYCPDCGEYVETRWYLLRCSCCGIKRVAIAKGQKIEPVSFYCQNCGESGYYVEELKKLNFVDINYAAAIKACPKPLKESFTQTWVTNNEPQIKLICACG